jgi:hypothetical protein
MTKLYLVTSTVITMMEGDYEEFMGIFSLIQLAEEAVLKQHDINEYKRHGNHWSFVFDGETEYCYDIREVILDKTQGEMDDEQFNAREILD